MGGWGASVSNRMEWSNEVFANIFKWMEYLKRGVASVSNRRECLGAAFASISNRMEYLKIGAACVSNRMEWSDEVFANISNWMECLKRGAASIFNRMVMFGTALAEWFHPEKQLGVGLARDNQLSLSRKLPSLAITTTRYRENCPRSR